MNVDGESPKPEKPLKLSQKIILAIGPRLVVIWLKVLHLLNKGVMEGEGILETIMEQEEPILVAVWHETAVMLVPKFAAENMHALASRSRDGELGARLLKCFGVDCVRGSSSRGGSEALAEMVKVAPNVRALGITIDGPRGPRRKSKPGIVVLSQRTGYRILPVCACATKAWRANSWDRMCIPMPFGKFIYSIGDPIDPPASDSPEDIQAKILEVEEIMNTMQVSIEEQYDIDAKWDPSSENN